MISPVIRQVDLNCIYTTLTKFFITNYNSAPGAYQSIDLTNTPAYSFGTKSDLNKPNNNPGKKTKQAVI